LLETARQVEVLRETKDQSRWKPTAKRLLSVTYKPEFADGLPQNVKLKISQLVP